MLRAALPLSRRAVLAPAGYRALVASPRQSIIVRTFADVKSKDTNTKPSIGDSKPPVLPGTESTTSDVPPPPGSVDPASPKPISAAESGSAAPTAVPLVPPAPPAGKGSSTGPQPVPKPKRRHRFRSFLLSLVVLSAAGFVGGVAYSLRSDNFHDFFTEYVPFGEEAVLYLEEKEFRKRFPKVLNSGRAKDNAPKIEIPQKSGLSWRVSEAEEGGSDLQTRGRHMSALDAPTPKSKQSPTPPATTTPKATQEKASKPPPAKNEPKPAVENNKKATPSSVSEAKTTSGADKAREMPEVNEPSVYVPVSRIDPLSIKNADEPLVQDLVKILNDIITIVNLDNKTGKFTSTFDKAKAELAGVGKRIIDLKSTEHEAAKAEVTKSEADFETAAKELVQRIEGQMREQESQWRDEFESERQKIARAYEERLHAEMDKSNEVTQQQLKSQLLEQALALKKDFTTSVQSQVEAERDGRLARLSELSSSVDELEKLTAEWNGVIDSNLKTQHLQVAVEAVRSNLDRTDRPRPFIKELAALKEIAADDAVVNSAIASINPIAYQRGIPTSAQLIDRFRGVADEVRKASLLPEDAGVASHAASFLLSKIMFKKQGRAVGDDVESILTRTETLLEEGNWDDAAREMNTLKGWAKTLSSDWLGEVRRVLEVRQAIEVISAEARLQSLKVD